MRWMSTKTRISFVLRLDTVARLEKIAGRKTGTVQDVCREAIDFYLLYDKAKQDENRSPALIAEDGSAERVRGFV